MTDPAPKFHRLRRFSFLDDLQYEFQSGSALGLPTSLVFSRLHRPAHFCCPRSAICMDIGRNRGPLGTRAIIRLRTLPICWGLEYFLKRGVANEGPIKIGRTMPYTLSVSHSPVSNPCLAWVLILCLLAKELAKVRWTGPISPERRLVLCNHVRKLNPTNMSGQIRNTMWDKRRDKSYIDGCGPLCYWCGDSK